MFYAGLSVDVNRCFKPSQSLATRDPQGHDCACSAFMVDRDTKIVKLPDFSSHSSSPPFFGVGGWGAGGFSSPCLPSLGLFCVCG